MSKAKIVPVNEAPTRIAALIEAVSESDEPQFIGSPGNVRAVLLGAATYDALIERLEDLEDNLAILEARISNESARLLSETLSRRM